MDEETFFKSHDLDRDGMLSFKEVVAMYHGLDAEERPELGPHETAEDVVRGLFEVADTNKDGYIDFNEFTQVDEGHDGFDVDYEQNGAAPVSADENIPNKYKA